MFDDEDDNRDEKNGPVLVLGHSGQVATDLVEAGAENDMDIMAIGRPQADLLDPSTPLRVIDRVRPSCIINAAAYTQVDLAQSEPELAMRINAEAPGWLAQICADNGVPLIHLSTDQVFDGRKVGGYTETDTPNPLCTYGLSKLKGEEAVARFCPQALIIRVSWVYGPSGQNFVTKVREWAQSSPQLKIVSDQWGRPTSSPELATWLLKLAECMKGGESELRGLLHLAGSTLLSRFEQATMIMEQLSLRGEKTAGLVPVLTKDFPTPAMRPLNAELDCTKARERWGISMGTFEEGLTAALDKIARPIR